MEIISSWTSIFLSGFDDLSSPHVKSPTQIKNYSVAFGRTTHEEAKKNSNKCTTCRHGDRQRTLTSFLQSETHVRLPRKEKKHKPYDFQQGKIHGRQIMNRNHDPMKAEAVRQRQKQYSIQVRNSRRNTASLNIDSLTRVVVQSFKNLIDCERCSLFLMDHKTDELYFKTLGGEPDVDCMEIRFPANSGVAGLCVKSRGMLNIRNAYQHPNFNAEIDKQTNFRTRTILCMPVLSSSGTVLGVIQMINKKKGDVKKILSDAKKKKSDLHSHFHGYDSGYEEFSTSDEDILKKCCEEVSHVLESILKETNPSAIEEIIVQDEKMSEHRPSTVSRKDSRRVSIGSLVQFVNLTTEINSSSSREKAISDVDISVTEAISRFKFRSVQGTPSNNAEDPQRAVAASRRKRMIDYSNTRRQSISSNAVANQGSTT